MGAVDESPPVLPVRRSRYQRTGRHSSPHQLSLPPEAPALVMAVPGEASAASAAVVEAIADSAAASCPGIGVHAGYLAGTSQPLTEVLEDLARQPGMAWAVVVPLLTAPHPQVDAELAKVASVAPVEALIASHLGPHPMLAEALHVRLAEAGLARSARVGRLSIVSEADGFIVAASGGAEAVQAAGVAAVLLASRLALPVAQACLDDPASVAEAADRLRAARVRRVALAPCIIGPEFPAQALEAVAAEVGAVCAAPLGGHPTIGRLVAMRYGAALEDPRLAELAR